MAIFIFGHKNPDTDTVCSSIALSYLKNALGAKTVPKVLGNINNETKFVLNYFNEPVPSYLNDVRVRIKNIKYDKKAYINENASIDSAFKLMQKQNITILIAGLQSKTIQKEIELSEKDILIVGDRHKVLEYAINSKVKLIILPLNINIEKRLIKKAEKNKINIIASEFDSFQIASKILLSNYIKSINVNKNPVTINNDDYYEDFKTMTHKINHTNYPIVNNKNECLGLIRLTGPNDYEKQKVILVDHNNLAQSVDGIEEAEILEIIDHHNLGTIGTKVPINFQSKPVGCTATIIYEKFVKNKVPIPRNIAGLMLSAIISDTLLLTSPTTTEDDKFVAIKLAKLAKVDIDKYGLEMLKAASSIEGKSIPELIKTDFKSYVVGNKVLGISQIMTMDFDTIKENINEYIRILNEMVEASYSVVVIFITDILKNGSYVIYNDKSIDIIKDSFGLDDIYQGMFLPKIVSRKKQIQPNIISVLEGD